MFDAWLAKEGSDAQTETACAFVGSPIPACGMSAWKEKQCRRSFIVLPSERSQS